MKAINLMIVIALLSSPVLKAQIDNAKTETVKVYGNCGMCEATIEKAAKKKKVSKADWNEQTKIATITYDSKKTDLDAVLKNIALAGYDNQNYLAPDDAYAKLPDCCKYERQSKHTVKATTTQGPDLITPKQDHTGSTQGKNTENTNQTSQLKPVFDTYFGLKDALVKTDGTAASAKASAMLTALEAVEMTTLKTEEHEIWMKVEKALKTDARHIKEKKDTEHQREHFMTLSKNMYELVKASKPVVTVYYQFCPMANDGKGANWLSKENTIKNPYYGSQMLSCGKTVETIKQ